jgi:hypothetical protein
LSFKEDFPGLKAEDFPNLKAGTYERTSPRDKNYNCVAWTVGNKTDHWWPYPDYFWPPGIRNDDSFEAFVDLYASFGYALCDDGSVEPGFEKVVIFGTSEPTHVAVQLPTGRWSSKLGGFDDDIAHDLEAVAGPLYGRPRRFMKRPGESTGRARRPRKRRKNA